MTDPFTEQYPDAAPYIWGAVAEHGEDWVIEHSHPEIAQLGVGMDLPDGEDLPFYDPDVHETVTAAEQRDDYEALESTVRTDGPAGNPKQTHRGRDALLLVP